MRAILKMCIELIRVYICFCIPRLPKIPISSISSTVVVICISLGVFGFSEINLKHMVMMVSQISPHLLHSFKIQIVISAYKNESLS